MLLGAITLPLGVAFLWQALKTDAFKNDAASKVYYTFNGGMLSFIGLLTLGGGISRYFLHHYREKTSAIKELIDKAEVENEDNQKDAT